MTFPGFTAEASFYKPTTSYRMMAGDTAATLQVVPAVASCTPCYGYRTGPFTFKGNLLRHAVRPVCGLSAVLLG
jgi:hypothetical protein